MGWWKAGSQLHELGCWTAWLRTMRLPGHQRRQVTLVDGQLQRDSACRLRIRCVPLMKNNILIYYFKEIKVYFNSNKIRIQ